MSDEEVEFSKMRNGKKISVKPLNESSVDSSALPKEN